MAVEIFGKSQFVCSACAPDRMNAEEVAADVNALNPPRGAGSWKVSGGPFRNGDPNPHPCIARAGYRHWLLEC